MLTLMYHANNDDARELDGAVVDHRKIGWWRRGWANVIDRVHDHKKLSRFDITEVGAAHPWGRRPGKTMYWDERPACLAAWRESKSPVLAAALDDQAFVETWNKLGDDYGLVFYLGGPHQIEMPPGSSLSSWVADRLAEIGPILDLKHKVTIGIDNFYGHPADHNPLVYGPGGAGDKLVDELILMGNRVCIEGAILQSAPHLAYKCGTWTTDEWAWVPLARKDKTGTHQGKPYNFGPWRSPLDSCHPSYIEIVVQKNQDGTTMTENDKAKTVGRWLEQGLKPALQSSRMPQK